VSAAPNVNDDTLSQKHNSLNGKGEIIAFISSTRCQTFSDRSMTIHDPTGPLLAIHSVVVSDSYRHRGVGSALLKNYLSYLSKLELKHGIQKVILMAKKDDLTFYLTEGDFRVMRQSLVKHGKDIWYECERELGDNGMKKGDRRSECWIVDSFALTGTGAGIGIGLGGRKGTGNPAAVVLVPAVLGRGVVTDAVGDTAGGGGAGTTPVSSSGDPAFFLPKPVAERKTSTSNNDVFLQDPDHESTISWMKTIAREFNLSETVFIWEHAPKTETFLEHIPQDSESNQQSPPQNQVLHQHFHNTSTDPEEASPHYTLRFYTCDGTPVDLCGHATLAASAVVFKRLSKLGINLSDMSVKFHVKNGVILNASPSVAAKSCSGSSAASGGSGGAIAGSNGRAGGDLSSMKINMCFPWKDVIPFDQESAERESGMAVIREAFFSEQTGTENSVELSEEDVLFIGVDEGGDDLLVELTSAAFFRVPKRMSDINFKCMLEFDGYTRGVILCCAVDEFSRRRQEEQSLSHPSARASETKGVKKGGGPGGVTVDFMSRFFGPKVGIEEDPVTGSAHCILGPYFANKLGRKTVVGKQKSQRGGIVECTVELADGLEISSEKKRTVSISGTAVMVMDGMLHI